MDLKANNVRGILKNEGDVEPISTLPKTAKFDELNVLATFHPVGKDYGHMIIDEPKTPFVFEDDLPQDLDTAELIEKLRLASQSETPAFGMEDDSDDSSVDEDYPESLEEKVRRLEFERRRKLHYKEFLSVPLARRLIAEEFGDFNSSEEAVLVATEEDCYPEECPTYELSNEEHLSPSVKTVSTNLSYVTSLEHMAPPEIEPGQEPSHPCYQKLFAEMNEPVAIPANDENAVKPEMKKALKSSVKLSEK